MLTIVCRPIQSTSARSHNSGRALFFTHRVDREDSNDFVPLGALIGLEAELLSQPACQPVDALLDFEARVCLTRQSAGKRVVRVSERVPAESLIEHKVADGNGIRRVKGELRHP
jgi:hypothetical protein